MLFYRKVCGTSMTEVLDILPYPEIPTLQDCKSLHSQFVYLIKRYPEEGLATAIFRDKENLCIRMGDFEGNVINPLVDRLHNGIVYEFWKEIMPDLVQTITLMGVDKCILYFSNDSDGLRLVDFRLSLNKFTGPGYIKDLFSKQMRTQEVIKVIQLDDKLVQNMIDGNGTYDGEYIIKPSRFKFMEKNGGAIPMYGKVVR